MGQKTNPKVLRLGIVEDWDSIWYDQSNYKNKIMQDFTIRNFINKELNRCGISKIKILRKSDHLEIIVHVARPGIIFGKSSIDLDLITSDLKQKIGTDIPKRINLHGGLWGMACNSIHFIDLVEWLTEQHLISVDTTNLDKKWVEAKRPGYYEVTGEISLKFSKGTELLLQSDPIHNNYLINIEISENNFWEINEHEGYMRHSSGELIFGKLSNISEISTEIIHNILKNETCDLTNLRDSCRQHSIILNSFLDHWNKYNNKKDKKVPIT